MGGPRLVQRRKSDLLDFCALLNESVHGPLGYGDHRLIRVVKPGGIYAEPKAGKGTTPHAIQAYRRLVQCVGILGVGAGDDCISQRRIFDRRGENAHMGKAPIKRGRAELAHPTVRGHQPHRATQSRRNSDGPTTIYP